MKITDIVRVKKFPWVCREDWQIRTPIGIVYVCRGFLSDGASGVPDLCPEAFFAHDRLYLLPEIHPTTGATTIRLTRWQCDQLYGWILRHPTMLPVWSPYRYLSSFWRPVGLQCLPAARKAWNKYRRLERMDRHWWAQERVVSKERNWIFPTYRTADAVWLYDGHPAHSCK